MELQVVVPCYNEAQRIDMNAFEEFARENPQVGFLFVNDGSTDSTLKILEIECSKSIQLNFLNLSQNMGKAEAIRQGVQSLSADAQTQFIAFFDADLATPLYELKNMFDLIKNKSYSLVMGTRFQRLGSTINRKMARHYIGRIFATLASIILELKVYDTQCGAKIFEKSLADKIFKNKFVTYWIFDVELLFRIKNIFKSETKNVVYEYPLIEWTDVSGSKLKPFDFLKAPFELIKIFMQYR